MMKYVFIFLFLITATAEASICATKNLKTVELFDGHPKELVQLAPDNADTNDNPYWTLYPQSKPWMVCTYTNGVKAIKKLPSGLKKCSVIFTKGRSSKIKKVHCQ